MGSAEGEAAPHDLLQPLPGLRQLEGGAEASSWGAVMDDGGAGPTPFSSAPVHTAPSETGTRGGARDVGRGWRGERRVDGKCLPIRSPPPSPGPSCGLQVTRAQGDPFLLLAPHPTPRMHTPGLLPIPPRPRALATPALAMVGVQEVKGTSCGTPCPQSLPSAGLDSCRLPGRCLLRPLGPQRQGRRPASVCE